MNHFRLGLVLTLLVICILAIFYLILVLNIGSSRLILLMISRMFVCIVAGLLLASVLLLNDMGMILMYSRTAIHCFVIVLILIGFVTAFWNWNFKSFEFLNIHFLIIISELIDYPKI